jgi:serine/threonine-protein kinase
MVGQTLAHYRLLDQVGQGAMASVYRALDLSLDREVAVKLLHPHLAREPESRLRFAREAKAVARLHHENILEIYAYSDEGSTESYLVTEFIAGPTLRSFLLGHRPRFPEVAAMIGWELSRALWAAHQMGIIHRDVKPENIMVRGDGTVVLCDFGIARILDKDTVTTTGQLLGSPAYMAPEHIRGEPQDGRSDLFSLGVVLYELLTGELPYRGRNPHETLTKIAAGEFTPVLEQAPLCSRELAAIVEGTLSTDPLRRPCDAAALERELSSCLTAAGISDPRAELQQYFKDPAAWEAAFAPRCLARLIECGLSLRRQGRVAAALQAWGRAQILAPEDAALQSLILGVARRRRVKRIVAVTCGVAALSCGLGLGVRALHGRWHGRPPAGPRVHDQPATRAPQAAPPAVAVLPPGAPPASALTPPVLSASSALRPLGPLPDEAATHMPQGRPKRLPLRPAVPERLRTVRLEPWPKAVTVSHNGKRLGAYDTDVRTVQLQPGINEFLFENPACYSERVTFPADSAPEEIRVRLRWKPALLQVRVHSPRLDEAPAGALPVDVVVDGHLVGRAGQVMALPVATDEGSQSVKVQVSSPGHQSASREVAVHANQLTSLDVQLVPR